jgi:NitT/TauT family transport system substrate-binding protein
MRASLAALAALCAHLLTAQPAGAADAIPLRYGQTASTWKSIFSLPIRIAIKQGFFAREGLAFSVVPVEAGGEGTLVALEDGKADIAHVATSFLITAAMRGADTVAIAAEFNNPIYSLVAKPWFKSVEDLKGRKIGMADMSGAVSLATLALFQKHGLDAKDLNIRVIEGTPARFQCLTQEDCDAVPLGQPQDFYAQRQGYRILGASSEAVPDFLYTVTAARRGWAAQNKDTVVRYIRALREAFHFIRDPANREPVVALIKEAWGSSEESARGTLDLFFNPEKNVLPMQGELQPAGLAQVVRFLEDGGVVKGPAPGADRLFDLQYLEAAGIPGTR